MRWLTLFLFLMCAPVWAADHPHYEPRPNLTVLADKSLMLPLAELTRDYAKRTRTPVTVVVKNEQDAQAQIEQGLEAHVVLTSNHRLLDQITEQGMTDVSSRRTVARARLALVTTHEVRGTLNLAERISFAAILRATDPMPVLTTAASEPGGVQAQELLAGQEFSQNLGARLVTKGNTEDVFNSLRDESALGLTLATSSIGEPDIMILSLLPDSLSPNVSYEVVVLGSELMTEAASFANYLLSRDGQAILEHHGYQTR